MKTSILLLAILSGLFTSSAVADDDATSQAKYYLRTLETQVAVAKEKPDALSAWQQCEGTLQGFEGAVAKLPEPERAPYLAKIKLHKPLIVAGAARNRADNLTRMIRRMFDSAREDIAAGNTKPANMQEAYYGKLDQWFADEDLKALPAEELKKLKAEYAELKKSAAK